MAVYNAVGDLATANVRTVVDRVNGVIWSWSGSGPLAFYDTISDTTSTFTRPGDNTALAFFSGDLYAFWSNASPFAAGISKMTVIGWTQVWSPPASAVDIRNSFILALRDEVIVANVQLTDVDGELVSPTVVYSTNGSTWTVGTIDGEDDKALIPHTAGPFWWLESTSLFLHAYMYPGELDFTDDIWEWSGSNWSVKVADFGHSTSANPQLWSASPDKNWRKNAAAAYEYSNDLETWFAIPNSDTGAMRALPCVNTPVSFGFFTNGLFAFDQPWNDAVLDWTEVFGSWDPTVYGNPVRLIRMNNGEMFLVSPNICGGGGSCILKRNNTFPDNPVWPTPSGARTWIYKTTDNGITWVSRGVITS